MGYCSCLLSANTAAIAYDNDTTQAIKVSAQIQSKAPNNNEISTNSNNPTTCSPASESISSAAGFYVGADIGIDSAKGHFTKTTNLSTGSKKTSNTGGTGDVFGGYNFQMGKFIFGLECLVNINSVKNSASITSGGTTDYVSQKKRYGFGVAPRIGYAISSGLNGYVNFGTSLSKYSITSADSAGKQSKKNPSKTSVFVGFGLEQSFGQIFVRGECNKFFKKNIGKVGDTSSSSDSYVFKIGGGYRF